MDWEKFRSNAKACFQKTKFCIFIMNWEKLRNPTRATFKNPKISLWIRNNLEVQTKTNTQKSQRVIYIK